MPDGGVTERLDRIETRQIEQLEAAARTDEQMRGLRGDVGDLLAEVGRVPSAESRGARLPITDRLHNIEAVVTPVAIRAAVHQAFDERKTHGWTLFQKSVTIAGVLVGMTFTVLRFAGLGG